MLSYLTMPDALVLVSIVKNQCGKNLTVGNGALILMPSFYKIATSECTDCRGC